MVYSQMVNATGLSDKTVIKIIKDLEKQNIIQVMRNKKYNYLLFAFIFGLETLFLSG